MLALVKQTSVTSASELDASLAKQFAWLLRKDLRKIFKTPDDPAFDDWWLIKGRQEYPVWAHAMPNEQMQALFETVGKASVGGVAVEVPKVVHLLARFRGDAVREYTIDGKLDNEKLFAWAIISGLGDNHLAAYATRHVIAMLDQPVPGTQTAAEGGGDIPAATLLMYLLWRIMDEPFQQARNIFKPEGRKAYLAWFFSVVGQLNITPLVAGRWKSWVKAQAGYKAPQLEWTTEPKCAPQRQQPTPKDAKPFGVNLYGFAYGELGIGEDLRMAVACCEAANIPYYVVNVDAGNLRQADRLLEGKTHDFQSAELPPYSNNIFCLPAIDTASRIFMQMGASAFEGYHNIGWWPWELSVFPKAWQPHAFKLVNEVWASSTFLEDMYKRSTHKPVHLVPLAVSVDRIKRHPRKYYGLPEKKYLFLYVFDFNSTVARKNPMATVKAFKQAFPKKDKSVGLVFKTMNTNPNNPDWQTFFKECKTDKRIHVLTETMDRPDVLGLIDCCDAYVSLHRAEGFGRTIAEAILLNKKIIATNYSGNVDFSSFSEAYLVDVNLISIEKSSYFWLDVNDHATWADVDINSASVKMVEINKFRKSPVNELNRDIFSVQKIGFRILDILNIVPNKFHVN